jgi:hypothetical protein
MPALIPDMKIKFNPLILKEKIYHNGYTGEGLSVTGRGNNFPKLENFFKY